MTHIVVRALNGVLIWSTLIPDGTTYGLRFVDGNLVVGDNVILYPFTIDVFHA